MLEFLTGNYAAAYGAKLSRVDVVSAYPITPQTSVIEKISEFVEKGELKAKLIRVESEHSAMAAVIGAAFSGARAYTATSAQGLLYMYEMIWWAAGSRLPVVAGIVTRAIAPPWSIWTDHSDFMTLRDTGWAMLFASSAQEVLDMTIQAFKLAEELMLPVAVGWDAFITSHTAEPVKVPLQEQVDYFLGEKKKSPAAVDFESPFAHGALAFPKDYPKFREDIHRTLKAAGEVYSNIERRYCEAAGRERHGLVEEIFCEDADVVMFIMGAAAGDAVHAAGELRRKGLRVGVARIRSIRPFPRKEVEKIARKASKVIVFDRSYSLGFGGVLATEIRSVLHEEAVDSPVISVTGGLGGSDLSPEYFKKIFLKGLEV